MTPRAKIRFVKNRIEDKAAISPKGPIVLRLNDLFGQTISIAATEQYSILKKLQEEGYLKGLIPLEKNDVWFELTDKPLDPFGLIAMNAGKQKGTRPTKKSFLISKDLKPEMTAGNLSSYSDGTIRYKGTIVKMRNQLKDLCRLFMEHNKRLLTPEDIKDNIVAADKRKTTSNSTISKYVSELRNSLKVHFKKDVIFSQKEEGWHFDVTKT